MSSPPAWSIGTSKRSTDWRSGGNPGPGSYNASIKNKAGSPGWKLGTASRSVDTRNDTPGPGSYTSPGKISISAPKYHFAGKTATEYKSFTPGPGAYNPLGLRGTDNKSPAFSFRVKTPIAGDNLRAPGPGAYDQTSRVLNISSPGYKIGTSKRDGLYQTTTSPGPGAYATRPSSAYNRESGPKFAFGTSERDEGLNSMSKTLPGPGQYTFKGAFESPGKGTTIVPRRPDSALLGGNRAPGPGAYNPSLTVKTQPPAYRIGSASRDSLSKERVGTPGPGNYDPKLASGGKNVKIGTSVRSPMGANSYTPGPGSYQYSTKVGEGPKYFMNPRREDVASTQNARTIPGPGAYTPSVELAKSKSPGIRIGTGSRDGLYDVKSNPGPGQYDTRGRITGPQWGFGNEKRASDYKSTSPGPGAYNLHHTVGEVPKYAYGSAPLKIHL